MYYIIIGKYPYTELWIVLHVNYFGRFPLLNLCRAAFCRRLCCLQYLLTSLFWCAAQVACRHESSIVSINMCANSETTSLHGRGPMPYWISNLRADIAINRRDVLRFVFVSRRNFPATHASHAVIHYYVEHLSQLLSSMESCRFSITLSLPISISHAWRCPKLIIFNCKPTIGVRNKI